MTSFGPLVVCWQHFGALSDVKDVGVVAHVDEWWWKEAEGHGWKVVVVDADVACIWQAWEWWTKWHHFFIWVHKHDQVVCVQPQGIQTLIIPWAYPHFSSLLT